MVRLTKKNLLKHLCKITAFICGYSLWHLLAATFPIKREITVPLSFYNTNQQYSITAPETITIMVQAKRSELNNLDLDNISAHIDETDLHIGDNFLFITHETLLLPNSIQVIDYPCTQIRVTMNKENNTDSL